MPARNATPLRGILARDEPLRRFTSWRVGGPADELFVPEDLDDLRAYLAQLPGDRPLLWIGLGSNLLVRDGGWRGAVVATQKVFRELTRTGETSVRAEAGVACARVARSCAQWQLGPATFFAGIPGTVGGALAMNAGAFGGETWERVARVETVDRSGELHQRSRNEYQIGYRSVQGPAHEWFVAAHFVFHPDASAGKQAIRDLLSQRKATQPIGLPSCGSVFRNPPGDHAARLIEAAGLKGVCVGGAQVSPMHANFIINTGEASAADIETLIEQVRDTVSDRFGVRLQPEVRIVGDPA